MKLFKIIIILNILLSSSCTAYCQYEYPGGNDEKEKKERSLNDKIFFSPNFGFAFWDKYAYAELSPLIGYKVTPRFWAGAGPKYLYYRLDTTTAHIYGPKFFTSFAVIDNISEKINIGVNSLFLYSEMELLSIGNREVKREWYNFILAGFGVRFPLGERSGVSLMVLWGLTEPTRNFYNNPEIRFSFDI